jgi:deoxyribose-phosphate aldolase
MDRQTLAAMIDHTALKPEARAADIDRLCDEAVEHGFAAVCVNPAWVKRCVQRLENTSVLVASVAGFPLGATTTETKMSEARRSLEDGAAEVDMVINLGWLLDGNTSAVTDDIGAVAEEVHSVSGGHLVKVILETAALNEEQVAAGCRCAVAAGADFVKTSTGFHPAGGATVDAVQWLRKYAPSLQVKAAGGIRDLAAARSMIESGAHRIGCSASVKIMQEMK